MVLVRRNSITDTTFESTVDVDVGGHGNVQVPVVKGNLSALPNSVQQFIAEHVRFYLDVQVCITIFIRI